MVASEYSTMSISASPASSLVYIILKIDLVFNNSSIKDMSLIYLRSASSSIALQNRIGAALLKFYQNYESSHSTKRFAKMLWSGTAEYYGMLVWAIRVSTWVMLDDNLSKSF